MCAGRGGSAEVAMETGEAEIKVLNLRRGPEATGVLRGGLERQGG